MEQQESVQDRLELSGIDLLQNVLKRAHGMAFSFDSLTDIRSFSLLRVMSKKLSVMKHSSAS